MKFKKGDKVKILRKDIKGITSQYGTVKRQNGHYVYVVPIHSKHEIELYDTEVELSSLEQMLRTPFPKTEEKIKCPSCKKEFIPQSLIDLYTCPLCGTFMPRHEWSK